MTDTTVSVEWEESPEQGELFKALAQAQGEMDNAAKSKANPFFKSKYADLAAIKEVTQAALTKYSLAITCQLFTRGPEAGVRMKLGHASGQWMACVCTTVPKDKGPQAMGSCWTYLRRYAKSALLDIATEDDDGENAEGRAATRPTTVLAGLIEGIDRAAAAGTLDAYLTDPEVAAKALPLPAEDKAKLRAHFEAAKATRR